MVTFRKHSHKVSDDISPAEIQNTEHKQSDTARIELLDSVNEKMTLETMVEAESLETSR